jgi:membrane protein implicated in regulation of membrane protease activity
MMTPKMYQNPIHSLLVTIGNFMTGMIIKFIPIFQPDVVTWTLQNLAFIATIVAAIYTVRNARRRKQQSNEKEVKRTTEQLDDAVE